MTDYTPSGYPDPSTRWVSALLDAEFALIAAAVNSKQDENMLVIGGTEAQGATVNDYVITVTPAITSYTTSSLFVFKATHTNTGAATLKASALASFALKSVSGGNLVAGDIVTNGWYIAVYNGTDGRLISITKNYVDQLAFSAALPAQISDGVTRVLLSLNGVASWGFSNSMGSETKVWNATLTATSGWYQILNSVDYGAAITLPDATTLGIGGPRFVFDNSQSAFPWRIYNSANTLLGFIPPRTVSDCYVRSNSTAAGEFGFTALELAGISSILNTVYLDVIIAEIDIGSNRDLILGYDLATGNSYAVCRNNLTNGYGAVVAVRAANVATRQAAISCGTDKVLVVSCDATTGFEAVVLSISTLTITVNAAVTATLSANMSAFADGCGLIAVGSSWVTSYTVATPAAQIRAISVSGTVPTVSAATVLDGTAGGLIMASGSVVIAASTATTNLYTKPYTISGATITPGTGTTTASGTMTLNKFAPIDAYWTVIYNDGGATVKGGIVSLSGTTTTISTATLFSAGVLEDAFVLSTTKVLVTNNQTSNNINILTNAAGTASAGTAATLASAAVNNIVCLSPASSSYVFTQSSDATNYVVARVSYSTASPVVSRQSFIGSVNTSTDQLPDFGKSNSIMTRSATCLYSTNFARTLNQSVKTQGFCGFFYKDSFYKKEGVTLNGISLGHYRGKNDRVRYITDQSAVVYIAECVA